MSTTNIDMAVIAASKVLPVAENFNGEELFVASRRYGE